MALRVRESAQHIEICRNICACSEIHCLGFYSGVLWKGGGGGGGGNGSDEDPFTDLGRRSGRLGVFQ